MNSLYFIGGSRGYGLESYKSDIDLLVISTQATKQLFSDINGYNLIYFPKSQLIDIIQKPNWQHNYQLIFNKPYGNGELRDFLQQNSETLFLNNRVHYYSTILENNKRLSNMLKQWLQIKSKEIMYLFFYLNVLVEYPKGNESLFSITHPIGDKQVFYLSIRNHEIPANDLQLLLNDYLASIDTTFWTEYLVDEKLNNEFLSILDNSTDFATYEELILPFTAEDIKSGQFQLDNSLKI